MPIRECDLPQLGNRLFLTDGGIETTLIFHKGLELPYFAAFHLMRDEAGRDELIKYYESHIAVAKSAGMGFILESPTWRASRDWGQKLGYSDDEVARINRCSVSLMRDLRFAHESPTTPMLVSGCVGPRGMGTIQTYS
jgi:S-methylmethionine-dependent homocysteine/selenocysteine methylase